MMKTILIAICLCCFVLPLSSVYAQTHNLSIGVQTWTLRRLSFEQVVEFAVKNGIKNLQMVDKHIDPYAPIEVSKQKKKILDERGLVLYTIGVAKTSLDKSENRKLFEFGKLMGIKLIIVEPTDFKILDNLEELVKEYDIRIAIHNHGIETLYGNPSVLRNLIKDRDPRIGVCLDAGWITTAGFDAEAIFRQWQGRVFDIHLKDVTVTCGTNRTKSTSVAIGTGNANLKGLLKAVKELKYDGVLAIETDANLKDATDFVVSAVRFVNAKMQ